MFAIVGFAESTITDDQSVREFTLNRLPRRALDHITVVRYIDRYVSTLSDEDDLSSAMSKGLFIASTHQVDELTGKESILVYRQTPSGSHDLPYLLHCISHEVGHSIYYHLPSQFAEDWAIASSSFSPAPELTARARHNELEDFCESFAIYILDPDALKQGSRSRFRFFEQLVTPLRS